MRRLSVVLCVLFAMLFFSSWAAADDVYLECYGAQKDDGALLFTNTALHNDSYSQSVLTIDTRENHGNSVPGLALSTTDSDIHNKIEHKARSYAVSTTDTVTLQQPAAVPEPASMALLAIGGAALTCIRRRHSQS